MKVIVITGSTRGIGLGLAKAFLERGCAVAVSGRTQDGVDKAVAELGMPERVVGHRCDMAGSNDLFYASEWLFADPRLVCRRASPVRAAPIRIRP